MADDGDPNIKQLRERAERAETMESALAAANQKIAVLQSGLDVESPIGQLFLKGYEGEYTPDALKEEAARYGVPTRNQPTQSAAEGSVEGEAVGLEDDGPVEDTGTALRRALADNAPADTGEDRDPRQLSIEAFQQSMREGMREEDAQAASLSVLAAAAMRGDPRVIYDDRAKHREHAHRILNET